MPVRDSVSDLTYEELLRAEAEANPGLLPEIGRIARGYVCDLYQNFPGSVVENTGGSLGLPNLRTALLDRMCRPVGKLPVLPPVPYQGGQCPIGYEVRVTYVEAYNFNEEIRERTQISVGVYWGKIESVTLGGIAICINGSLAVKGSGWIAVRAHGGWLAPRQATISEAQQLRVLDNARCFQSITSTLITPLGGASDNCGNPLPVYPPKHPPLASVTNNVTINNNLSVAVNVPISIVPTLIAPVSIVVKPELNVNVGGVNVNFGLDGVRFTQPDGLAPGLDIKFDPRITIPSPINNDNSVEISGGGCDLSPVLTKLEEIEEELKKCCDRLAPFPEPDTSEYDTQVLPHLGNGKYVMPSRTFTVTVEVTAVLPAKKTIDPENGDRVLFCGWVWFKSQGALCTREPLDADKKAFKPPERADNEIIVSTYVGYTVVVRAWYAKADA